MDRVFDFIVPYIERERDHIAQKDLLTVEGVLSALKILEKRLVDLVEPVVSGICREEMERIAPASVLGPSFVSPEQREEAREAAAKRLRGPEDPFLKYTELDRCRLTICSNFRRFMDEFFARLESGREEIRHGLLNGRDMGRVCRLSSSGADCHLHGASALRVETEGGAFYYKPRDCGPDELFARLAGRFFDGKLRAPHALSFGGSYGFVEAIRVFGLENEKDIGNYYYHFGILLALFRSLGSNDMHFENIVASGVYPVCIDLETMLTPIRSPFEGTDYRDLEDLDPVVKRILLSSANSMALPMMLQGKAQMSPLFARSGQSLPVYRGEKWTVRGYEDRLTEGFSEGYEIIRENAEEIFALLIQYKDMASRYVLRASSYYALTMRQMHSPLFLEDRSRKDQELDRLGDRLTGLKKEDADALISWEKESLEEGDIPFFSLTAGGHSLYGAPHGACLVRDFFAITALDHASLCLRSMGEEEKRFEMDYLWARLMQAADFSEESGRRDPGLSVDPPGTADEPVSPMSWRDAGQAARGLLDKIRELGIRVSDQESIFLSFDNNLFPQYFQGVGKGLQGMALFFAKCRTGLPDGCSEAGDLLRMSRSDTKRLVRQLSHTDLFRPDRFDPDLSRSDLSSPDFCAPDPSRSGSYRPDFSRPDLSGAGTGVFGILTGIGGTLLSPACDDSCAKDLLSMVLSRVLSLTEKDLPVLWEDTGLADGPAGLAAGLDALAADRGEEDMLRALWESIADRLLAADDEKQGFGLMKGKAGLLYALGLCAGHVGAEEKRDQCVDRCRNLLSDLLGGYSEKLGAWPDRERLDRPLFPACDLERGAPGIGLMASRCLSLLPEMEELLRLAADSIRSDELLETDTLLKGNAGAALCLIEAARALNDRSYLAHAGRILQKMKERADRAGGFRVLPARYTNAPDPSFMDGFAGIGYVYLRYAELVRAGEAEDPAHGSGEAHRQSRQSRKRERSLFPV